MKNLTEIYVETFGKHALYYFDVLGGNAVQFYCCCGNSYLEKSNNKQEQLENFYNHVSSVFESQCDDSLDLLSFNIFLPEILDIMDKHFYTSKNGHFDNRFHLELSLRYFQYCSCCNGSIWPADLQNTRNYIINNTWEKFRDNVLKSRNDHILSN